MLNNISLSRRALMLGAATAAACATGAAVALADNAQPAEGTPSAYDVLVIGAGLAGLSAGIKLLELGVKKVLVVTKADDAGVGTNSIVAGGTFNFPSDSSETAIQALIDVYNLKSNNKGRQDLTRLIVENAAQSIDWLKNHGCEFTDPVQLAPYDALQCNAAPGSGLGMPALMGQLASEYAALGGELMTETKLIDFAIDEQNGAVCGAILRNAEGLFTVTAQAVVVATGGYVANKQLLEQYVGPDGDEIMIRGQQTLTGDGLLAAVRAGGMIYQAAGMNQTVHLAAVAPENPAMCNPYNAIQRTIAINTLGQRYVDESKGYVTNGKAVFDQPGQTCALVFDATAAQIDGVKNDMEKFSIYGAPVHEAQTIAELAGLIGVDAAALEATVSEFNAAIDGDCTTGLTVDKTACAAPIAEPPFYAFYPLNVGSIMGYGGIFTDGDCRVLEADGTPIAGLYAAGEIIGGVFQYDYLQGSSLDRSVVTGIHVAQLIVDEVLA